MCRKSLILSMLALGLLVGSAQAQLITGLAHRNTDTDAPETPLVGAAPLAEGSVTFLDRVHIYNHALGSSSYQKWDFKKNRFDSSEMDIPNDTQDILSAFYAVRNSELTVGKPVVINVVADGRFMRTEVKVHRKEMIKTIFGETECLVIEPRLKGEAVFKQSGRILIWLTNDAYKIPVRLESKITIGSFVAVLDNAWQVPYKVKS